MRPGLRKQLDEEGYVILRGLVEPQVVAEARADLDGLVDELAAGLIREGQVRSFFAEEPFETRIYRLYRDCLDRAPQSFRRELHLPGIFGYFFSSGPARPGRVGFGRRDSPLSQLHRASQAPRLGGHSHLVAPGRGLHPLRAHQ